MDYCETYGLVQTVAPSIEPVLWTDIKGAPETWSRDPGDGGQSLVETLIVAAREKVETWTNRQLITATWALTLDKFPDWMLWLPGPAPFLTVSSITYTDGDGTTQTLSASNYRFHAATGRIEPSYGNTWPSTRDQVAAVTVTTTNGYGTAATSVPGGIKLAIMATVLDWLENRALRFELPPGVKEMLREYQFGRIWG